MMIDFQTDHSITKGSSIYIKAARVSEVIDSFLPITILITINCSSNIQPNMSNICVESAAFLCNLWQEMKSFWTVSWTKEVTSISACSTSDWGAQCLIIHWRLCRGGRPHSSISKTNSSTAQPQSCTISTRVTSRLHWHPRITATQLHSFADGPASAPLHRNSVHPTHCPRPSGLCPTVKLLCYLTIHPHCLVSLCITTRCGPTSKSDIPKYHNDTVKAGVPLRACAGYVSSNTGSFTVTKKDGLHGLLRDSLSAAIEKKTQAIWNP